jgi:hypothetical protein
MLGMTDADRIAGLERQMNEFEWQRKALAKRVGEPRTLRPAAVENRCRP